jgi:hypothetical protein
MAIRRIRQTRPFLLFPLLLLGAVIALAWNPPSPAPPPPGFTNRRAIVFGIDGLRSDALKLAVENGTAPNIAALIRDGAVTWNAYAGGNLGTPTQQATNSGPGWASVLTGVWTNKHGVTNNAFTGRNFTDYPHFFKTLKALDPSATTSSLVSWPEINNFIVEDSGGATICDCHTYTSGSYDNRDAELTTKAVELINTGLQDVMFHYLGAVDIAGHTYGFSPTIPEYMQAIAAADARVGLVLNAVRNLPDFDPAEWLFVLTTDHGGIGFGHGGQSNEERIIPFIASGGNVPKGIITREVIGQVAVPATVFRHLGRGIPADWGWESDAFQIGAKLHASTAAQAVLLAWSLPPAGIEGLTGYTLSRNGTPIATLPPQTTHFTDPTPAPPGTTLTYTLTFLGSSEAPITATTPAPGSPTPGDPPVLHLSFNDNLLDSSGRNNHATPEGTPSFTSGKSGNALVLNASSTARLGSTTTGAPADLLFGANTDFTISLWFKANSPWTTDPSILSNKNWDSGANQGWIIAGENNGNDWQWNLKGNLLARRDFDPSNANIAGSTWRHILITHDRDGLATFHHDGQIIGTSSIANAGNIDTTFPIRIGRDGNNSYPWTQGATIDELKIWRRLLTPAEIAAESGSSSPLTAYQAWIADQASLHSSQSTLLNPADDPDADGADNLLEYACGTSPFRPNSIPHIRIESSLAGKALRITQRDGGTGIHGTSPHYLASGLRYTIQQSPNLQTPWSSIQGTASQNDNSSRALGNGLHEVAIDLPASSHAFFRLQVEFDTP